MRTYDTCSVRRASRLEPTEEEQVVYPAWNPEDRPSVRHINTRLMMRQQNRGGFVTTERKARGARCAVKNDTVFDTIS